MIGVSTLAIPRGTPPSVSISTKSAPTDSTAVSVSTSTPNWAIRSWQDARSACTASIRRPDCATIVADSPRLARKSAASTPTRPPR